MNNSQVQKNDNLEESSISTIIANEDWPMLNELENTRFNLKKKTPKTIVNDEQIKEIAEMTEMEDSLTSVQSNVDELNIASFLNNQKVAKVIPQNILKDDDSKEKTPTFINSSKNKKDNSFLKLVTIGLGKLYLNKTNALLNPLKFVMENIKKVSIACLQFIIPAIFTYYLVVLVPSIQKQINSEDLIFQGIYIGIFYFACMFVWISSQVILSGLINSIKNFLTNVAKTEQNS